MHSISDGKCGAKLIRNFTLQSNVVQAVWCTFYDEDEGTHVEAVCAMDAHNIEIFSKNGDNFPIGLPFQVILVISVKNPSTISKFISGV